MKKVKRKRNIAIKAKAKETQVTIIPMGPKMLQQWDNAIKEYCEYNNLIK